MLQAEFFGHRLADPCFNMGFDEWLLAQAMTTPGYVALRLYSWAPGAITFGFNQKQETALDWQGIGGTPVVRRITGGRALFHDPSELTYAVVANQHGLQGHPLGGSLSESSTSIARALVTFLAEVGVKSDYERQSSADNSHPTFFHKAPCFASVAKYEIVREQEKLIASAQRRHAGCLLQHGSIKLQGLVSHAALPGLNGVAEGVYKPFGPDEFERLSDLLKSTFSRQFGILFRDGQLGASQNLLCDRAVTQVRKNPLGRREIIAQPAGANSL